MANRAAQFERDSSRIEVDVGATCRCQCQFIKVFIAITIVVWSELNCRSRVVQQVVPVVIRCINSPKSDTGTRTLAKSSKLLERIKFKYLANKKGPTSAEIGVALPIIAMLEESDEIDIEMAVRSDNRYCIIYRLE